MSLPRLLRAPVLLSSARINTRTSSFIMAPARRAQSSLPASYKEDLSKGAMLRFEDTLPQLPVPSLEETAKRYTKSLHALLSPSEFENSKRIIQEFFKPGGQGEVLQKRLQAHSNDPSRKNWIAEWWDDAAYLTVKDPVVPYVSYFYAHRDDRRRRNPIKRAAAITTAVLEFKKMVDNKSLEPEYMRKLPIAMSSYKWMFNACRIPDKSKCFPVKYDFKEHPYFVVIRKNQFFKVMHESGGKQLNTAELELQFKRVYEKAEKCPAVGSITAERRDISAQMRENLIAASPANAEALKTIEASSFIVCLDDTAPVTLEERAHVFWHGDGANRWYDKPLQFIINDNGTSGFMGEHSMMDGTPTHRLNDYAAGATLGNKLDFSDTSVRSSLPDPAVIKFVLNEQIEKDIEEAHTFFVKTIAEHELRVLAFQGYGKGLMKKLKCSPDAFVQMIIQLAYHKMYGKNRPTYESAATRKFQLGRTETCRSVSDESVAFCDAMADPDVPPEKCAELFRTALKAHVQYISDAADGRGVDRHLFGLKKVLKPGEELPDLFKDPAFAYSSSWYLSSSQLSSEFFNGYGWSQVIDDGWGIAYMINEYNVQFNIVSKRLGADRFAFYLTEAASEIRDMMLPSLEAPKSKL